MGGKYEPSADTVVLSDVVIRGWRFTKRELFLGITCVVLLVVVIILAAVLVSESGKDSDQTCGSQSAFSSWNRASCNTPACFKAASHVLELMDPKAADPCQDFYTYACSNFKELHPLEPDEAEVTTFQLIYRRNLDKVRRLIEAVPATEDPNHYEAKVKHFYQSCIDDFQRMTLKGTPFLDKVVRKSGGWWVLNGDVGWPPSDYSFQKQLEKIHVDFWRNIFFSFHVASDWVDWNKATIEISLGGLGLNYFSYTNQTLVAGYREYLNTVGSLLIRDAGLQLSQTEEQHRLDTFVNDTLSVEMELAELMRDAQYTENPYAHENRPTVSDLNNSSRGEVDWLSLFKYMFHNSPEDSLVTADTHVVVHEQDYLDKFITWLRNLDTSTKKRKLNNYMIWRLADSFSYHLSADYAQAYYASWKNRTGTLERPPAWFSCLLHADASLFDALGALYVKDHFSGKGKERAHNITDYVKDALVSSLTSQQHWMSSETRAIGRKKLQESLIKLGYPDYMMNETALNLEYRSLTIKSDDYLGNMLSIYGLARQSWITYYSHPNDHSVWVYATYSTRYEYYNPWKELIIPAGVMQFPIFDQSNPWYMNFGALGSRVGYQLTHAVDEFGNLFFLNGSHFGEWWSAETTARYRNVSQCMITAYQNYTMGPAKAKVPDFYSPYALSLSSGIKLAYKGYKEWTKVTGEEKTMPGGLYTNDQMFFISYAQSYCANRDAEEELKALNSGYHVTAKLQVNGALAQLEDFQEAFQCKTNDHMVAQKRCSLY